jgi:hypothetical protein
LDSICWDDLLNLILDYNGKTGLASNVQALKNFLICRAKSVESSGAITGHCSQSAVNIENGGESASVNWRLMVMCYVLGRRFLTYSHSLRKESSAGR